MINIEVMQVGALATNCYVLSDRNTNEGVIIDPGGDADHIQSYLETRDVNPIIILATHAHADHTGAVKTLAERYGSQFMDSLLIGNYFMIVSFLLWIFAGVLLYKFIVIVTDRQTNAHDERRKQSEDKPSSSITVT